MNALDERARQAAASARRLADTVDPEDVLDRIEGRATARRRWLVPAVALGAAATVVGVAIASGLLGDGPLRIDERPGVIGTPDTPADDAWPPAGAESEDGWVRLEADAHGIEGLASDVVVFEGDFLLLDAGGRLWRSTDGVTWENRAGLNLPNGDLVVDRGRIVAMAAVEDGRELRVMWSEDGDDWNTVENRGQLSVSVGESEWFRPQLVAGPRGFLIASAVWQERAAEGNVTSAANLGATIRVLESPDGENWRSTVEWGNEGVADLIGVAGDTNGYTLVFHGDDVRGEVNKGATRAFVSGDEEWTEVADHPGGIPVRIERDAPVPFVGDAPGDGAGGDRDLTVPGVRFHTWEFALSERGFDDGLWFRTAAGWEQAQFDGVAGGVDITRVWDAGDALYATGSGGRGGTEVFRSEDGYLWTALPRDPVFAGVVQAGGHVIAATSSDGRSVFGHDCCEPGVYDRDTSLVLWVRQAPAGSGSEGRDPQTEPTATPSCGTDGMSAEPSPQAGLPDAVQAMRVEIASALVRCDHGLLTELALAGSGEFTASFGGVDDLQAWFAAQDLGLFRRLLDLPYASATSGDGVTYYAWPSAFLESTDDAWQALYDADLATPDDRTRMEEAFGGWVGFRHGITAEGDWIFTVAGD